jgi:hypothetical protein
VICSQLVLDYPRRNGEENATWAVAVTNNLPRKSFILIAIGRVVHRHRAVSPPVSIPSKYNRGVARMRPPPCFFSSIVFVVSTWTIPFDQPYRPKFIRLIRGNNRFLRNGSYIRRLNLGVHFSGFIDLGTLVFVVLAVVGNDVD